MEMDLALKDPLELQDGLSQLMRPKNIRLFVRSNIFSKLV